jgi:hypothetical protein
MDVRNSVGMTFIRPSPIRKEGWDVSFQSHLETGTWAMSEKPGFSLPNDLIAEHTALW